MRTGSLALPRPADVLPGVTALSTALRPARPIARPLAAVRDVLGDVDVIEHGDVASVVVSGVTHDSRAVQPGDLYAALPGERFHGAQFAHDAAAAGAVAVLTDRVADYPVPALVVADPRRHLGAMSAWVYGDPAADLDVVGITGTNGKTTTAYLVDAGFAASGRATGLIGTVETRVAGSVLPSAHTTPEAPELHALLAVMRERGVTGVAMEVSSHGLALGRVDGVRYAAAVFTNLSQDHLDFHADMDDYFRAKALLFEASRTAVAVINVDDPAGERLRDQVRVPAVLTSAAGREDADWRATSIVADASGTTFTLAGPALVRPRPLRLRLPGRYNVDNALGAVAFNIFSGECSATSSMSIPPSVLYMMTFLPVERSRRTLT